MGRARDRGVARARCRIEDADAFSTSAIRNAPFLSTISISTGARWAQPSSAHPRFPQPHQRFFCPVCWIAHTIDVRFFERGAGETMSSGTGSTGAPRLRPLAGWSHSPVEVRTPAGPLKLRWEDATIFCWPDRRRSSPRGEFYL